MDGYQAGTNITGSISTISGTTETYNPPEPWLYGNNGITVSGICQSTFTTPFSSVSGKVNGLVTGDLNTKLVSGMLTRYIKF